MREFVDAYTAAKVKAKYNHVVGEVSKAALEKAGFEDVTLTRFTIPWGPWSEDKILKEVGLNFAASMDTGLEVCIFIRILWSLKENITNLNGFRRTAST